MSSGGGSTQTSTSGIDPEFKPELKRALGIATSRLEGQFDEAGNLIDPSAQGIVADLATQQREGLGAQQALARQALTGTGMYDDRAATQRMLQNLSGAQTAQMMGSLGSARADRAQQAALADMAYEMQQGRQAKAEGGAQSLQDVGGTLQEQQQRILDAPYTELQRYSNILTGMAPKQTTATGSGGK